jgi:hypothetical protein
MGRSAVLVGRLRKSPLSMIELAASSCQFHEEEQEGHTGMNQRRYKNAEIGNISMSQESEKKRKKSATYLHSVIISCLFPPLSLFDKEFKEAIEALIIQRDECPGALVERCVKSRSYCARSLSDGLKRRRMFTHM